MHLKVTVRVAHAVKRTGVVDYAWSNTKTNTRAMYLNYRVIVTPCITSRGSSYQLFVRREPHALKFTFAGIVSINSANVLHVDACVEEGIKCALTCMINCQFCYTFDIMDIDIKMDNNIKKGIHSYFELGMDLRQATPPGSLFIKGELHNGLYHPSYVPPTSGLPFKITVDPSNAEAWRATLNSVSQADLMAKRFKIYRTIYLSVPCVTGVNEKNFLRDVLHACDFDFAQLYKVVPYDVLHGNPPVVAPAPPPPPPVDYMPPPPPPPDAYAPPPPPPDALAPPTPDSPRAKVQKARSASPEPPPAKVPRTEAPVDRASLYYAEEGEFTPLDFGSDDCNALVESFWAEEKK